MNDPVDGTLRDVVRGHMPSLDGLRGIAILLVLMHAFDVLPAGTGMAHVLDLLLDAGWIGVQLFFVLSGFLITGILLDTRNTPGWYRGFFVRRVLRIFPLYFGVLAIAFLVVPVFFPTPAGYGSHQAWLWTFTENYAAPFDGGEVAFPHFWSLCVEEQFYLAWPLVVALCARRGTAAVSIALVAMAIASRFFIRQHFGEPVGHEAAYMFTFCRMDALAIGAMAAVAVRAPDSLHWINARRSTTWVIAGSMVVVAGLLIGHWQRVGASMQAGGYTIVASGFALLLLGVLRLDNPLSRLLSVPALRSVGKYSYGMYVFHAPLHLFIGLPLLARSTQAPTLPGALLYLLIASVVTYAVAALSYHGYERHFLKLKPRLAPRPAT